MKHFAKVTIICLLVLMMLVSLCACGSSDSANSDSSVDISELKRNIIGITPDDFQKLVQGNLDELYLGKYDDKYLALVDSTAEDAQKNYEDGLAYEADFFCYYFDVEYPTEAYMQEVIEVYREIYSHSKYTVGDVSELDESTYVVKLTVSPINIMELVIDAIENGAADSFYNKYANVDIEAMSEEDYIAYDEEWAAMILDIVRGQLPNIGYCEDVSMAVQIISTDDIWMIGDNDMQSIDAAIIEYP